MAGGVNANINIAVKNLQALNRLEQQLVKVNKSADKIVASLARVEKGLARIATGKSGFRAITREANEATKSVGLFTKILGKATAGGRGTKGLLGLGLGLTGAGVGVNASINQYNKLAGGINAATTGLNRFGISLALPTAKATGLMAALKGIGAAAMASPAALAVLSVAAMALGLRVDKAAKSTYQLGQAFGSATKSAFSYVDPLKIKIDNLNVSLERQQQLMRAANPGMRGNVVRNRDRSRLARERSGFGEWSKRTETATQPNQVRDAALKSLDRHNRKLQKQGKEILKVERLLSKEDRLQLKLAKQKIKEAADEHKMLVKLGRQARRNAAIKRKDAKARMNENLMLGIGFPMLFGGGPGAVIGGASGALLQKGGKGFGAQILLSALGQQIDAFVSSLVGSTAKLGKAIGEVRDMDQLIKSLGLAGTAFGQTLLNVEGATNKQEAFNIAMRRLQQIVGRDGVRSLKSFGDEVTRLQSEWEIFSTLMLASIAKFIEKTGLLKKLVDSVQSGNLLEQAENLYAQGGGSEEFRSAFERRDFDEKRRQKQLNNPGGFLRSIVGNRPGDPLMGKEISNAAGGFMERTEHNRNIVELMKKELELQKEIDQNKLISSNFNAKDMHLLNLRLKLLKTEGDLTDDKVFKLEQAIIHQTTDLKLQEAINDNKSTALILKQHEIDMQELLNKRTQQFKNETIDVEEAWKRVNQTITSSVTSGIKGLIKGTATWADLLNNVADKFLEIALNQAIYGNILGQMGKAGGGKTGGILGFLGFADGGRPPVGKPSIVGEKGPELFVPSSSGKIVPNHELGGGGSVNVTVNVDASGTDVQGDDSQAKQLGTMLSAAVQAELVKQKRPGGLLAGVA